MDFAHWPRIRSRLRTFLQFTPSPKSGTLGQMEERPMQHDNDIDRRLFLGAATAALLSASNTALAQQPQSPKANEGAGGKPTQLVSAFVAGFDLSNAPPLALERARTAFIDTMGVMLAGSRTEPAAIVCEMVRAEGAKPAASIVGQSLRSSPQLAALANGVASHALDFDFTYTQGQLVAPVIPALLPLAESTGASPAEVLAAFIVGFEVCSRLSRANPNHNGGGAWHGTGTIGTIGAAAACARLVKLPAAAIPDVLGIGVSMAAGVNANYGTMTKPLHAGQAARNAIAAAQLGGRGFTANAAAIEGRGGFAQTFARGLEWHPDAFADLGRQFDLAERGFRPKRYPCGGVIHTGIDAALKIREDLMRAGIDPRGADIAAIKAGISTYAANRASEQYPTNTEAAKFNLQYVVAYALANGVPKLASFGEEAIRDARVKALAGLVAVAIDPQFVDAREDYPTRVTVTLKDGRSFEQLFVYASGTRQYPMSPAQMEEKFFDCAQEAVSREVAGKILAALATLGEQPSFDGFWPLLRTG
jgi:2-methylcitrate dehydratase PrpD